MPRGRPPKPVVVVSGELKPWEIQPGETAKSYEAFCVYRDMARGERTLAECSRRLGQRQRNIEEWGRKHNWQERALMYDNHLDRLNRSVQETAVVQMAKKHAAEAVKLREAVLKKLEDRLANGNVSDRLLFEMYVETIKIERQALSADAEQAKPEGEVSAPNATQGQDTARRIAADPEARRALVELHRRRVATGDQRTGTA